MIADRKDQHLDIVLNKRARPTSLTTGFERLAFEHVALPELRIDDIDLRSPFLGKTLAAPLLVSSMTGGPARAADINRNLATACAEKGIALAVGSQRVAIERGADGGLTSELRRLAPDIVLLANLGAAQLNRGFGIDHARRAVEMIGADGLIIHVNPLQEVVQPEGDRDWRGLIDKIERLASDLEVPLIVKEVGSGISPRLGRALLDRGVAAIDVAGAGGTNWAAVEAERIEVPWRAELARSFADWGIPTADAIRELRLIARDATIIGSGGVRSGIDAAKAIRLGADVVGCAAGILAAALHSAEAVADQLSLYIEQLRIVAFCTGSATIADLRDAKIREASAASP